MNRTLKLRGIVLISSLLLMPLTIFADERSVSKKEMKERWASMSEDERQAAREKRAKRYSEMSDEERAEMREKRGGGGVKHDAPNRSN